MQTSVSGFPLFVTLASDHHYVQKRSKKAILWHNHWSSTHRDNNLWRSLSGKATQFGDDLVCQDRARAIHSWVVHGCSSLWLLLKIKWQAVRSKTWKTYAEVVSASLPKWSPLPFSDHSLLSFWFKILFYLIIKEMGNCYPLATSSGNCETYIKTKIYYIRNSEAPSTCKLKDTYIPLLKWSIWR